MSADVRVHVAWAASALLILLLVAGVAATPRRPAFAPRGARIGGPPGPAPGDFSPEEQARGTSFRRRLRPLAYAQLVANLAVALALGATPLGGLFVEWVSSPLGDVWYWQAMLGVLALLLVASVATLPIDIRAESLLRAHGVSVQTWTGWVLDRLKGLLLTGGVLVVLAFGGYALVRALPDTWWIVAALAAAGLTGVFSFVFPVVVEPIFSRFRPLGPGQLRNELLEIARRDGVSVDDVLVADASRRTTSLNAYVSGFGRTRRIVVFDTLLTSATQAEVRLVVAHELGHAAERDVVHGTALGAAGAAFGVLLVALVASDPALLELAHASSVADPRALGLVLLVLAVLGLVTRPLSNLTSRRVEARADLHSLVLTRDPEAFVASERRLALTNLADLAPSGAAHLLFASHPSVPQRIAMARAWAEQQRLPIPGPALGPSASGASSVVLTRGEAR